MNEIYIQDEVTGPNGYQSFFTDAEEINNFMISLLGDVTNLRVLEPCAGQGAFIRPIENQAYEIDAVDIDPTHSRHLAGTTSSAVRIQTGDFIDFFVRGGLSSPLSLRDDYDAVICNPPYGLKFTQDYRKIIKSKHPDLYARESYGLFMVFGIRCLREGGRFVYIVPNTFLTSRNHKSLRKFLAANTDIDAIVQFSSSRFETVNFGYGSLCIISGRRTAKGASSSVAWADYRDCGTPLNRQNLASAPSLAANVLLREVNDGWANSASHGPAFITQSTPLGSLAECRTGIYTGDNPRFCGYDESSPPSRVNGHPIDWSCVVDSHRLSDTERQLGITGDRCYVPFVRGGHRAPFEDTRSALDWSRSAVSFYQNDKKARLQNARFYFRSGLAVPMVTSGRLSASFMNGSVFDQGVVGIFPKDADMLEFLLVYLNSIQATELKKIINPGANNSANYLKRIMVPNPNEAQLREAREICNNWKTRSTMDKSKISQVASDFVAKNFLPSKIAA